MFSRGTMTYMQALVGEVFFDHAQRLVSSSVDDGYGYGQAYTPGDTLDCLFLARAQADAQGGTEVPMIVADIYFRRGALILPDDRLIVTHLHGEVVDAPQTYSIVEGPVENHMHVHAELSLVTDGS